MKSTRDLFRYILVKEDGNWLDFTFTEMLGGINQIIDFNFDRTDHLQRMYNQGPKNKFGYLDEIHELAIKGTEYTINKLFQAFPDKFSEEDIKNITQENELFWKF